MDVSDRGLHVQLTQEAKIASDSLCSGQFLRLQVLSALCVPARIKHAGTRNGPKARSTAVSDRQRNRQHDVLGRHRFFAGKIVQQKLHRLVGKPDWGRMQRCQRHGDRQKRLRIPVANHADILWNALSQLLEGTNRVISHRVVEGENAVDIGMPGEFFREDVVCFPWTDVKR